jgi:hypothetical protein
VLAVALSPSRTFYLRPTAHETRELTRKNQEGFSLSRAIRIPKNQTATAVHQLLITVHEKKPQ